MIHFFKSSTQGDQELSILLAVFQGATLPGAAAALPARGTQWEPIGLGGLAFVSSQKPLID